MATTVAIACYGRVALTDPADLAEIASLKGPHPAPSARLSDDLTRSRFNDVNGWPAPIFSPERAAHRATNDYPADVMVAARRRRIVAVNTPAVAAVAASSRNPRA
jgi:hypothetical protein